jgi:exodeoxyribonuclease VII large subunit
MTEPDSEHVLSVTDLTAGIKGLLAAEFGLVTVRGQISNLRRQSSGHAYFSLKDDGAQIGAVMWRYRTSRLRFRPEDGQEVLATGKVDVYPPHGKYQLVVDRLEPLGVGALHVAFEQLKQRLAAEGLFGAELKQPLPFLPTRVAVVTSPSGAALRDFLRVAFRRMPGAWITVFPVRVQGDEAPDEIVDALERAGRLIDVDVIVATRGGGSIEDLWSFNEERVARAMAACPVPVVNGVGHETDTTIADYVADARAATPSEAAELVFPEVADLTARLTENRGRLDLAVNARLRSVRERIEALGKTYALAQPVEALRRHSQRLDELEERALAALGRRVDGARERVGRVAGHLEAVSPLAVLSRGYSITTREDDRAPVVEAATVAAGDRIVTRLHAGRIVSEVREIRTEEE